MSNSKEKQKLQKKGQKLCNFKLRLPNMYIRKQDPEPYI